jgi:hypothetical protein
VNIQSGCEAEFIEAGVVKESGGDDGDAVTVFGKGHDAAIDQNSSGELGEKFFGWRVLGAVVFEIDEGKIKIGGDGAEELFLRDAVDGAEGIIAAALRT